MSIVITRKDCPPGVRAVIRKKGTVLLGYLKTVTNCPQHGNCVRLELKGGRVEHFESYTEAREEVMKL